MGPGRRRSARPTPHAFLTSGALTAGALALAACAGEPDAAADPAADPAAS